MTPEQARALLVEYRGYREVLTNAVDAVAEAKGRLQRFTRRAAEALNPPACNEPTATGRGVEVLGCIRPAGHAGVHDAMAVPADDIIQALERVAGSA